MESITIILVKNLLNEKFRSIYTKVVNRTCVVGSTRPPIAISSVSLTPQRARYNRKMSREYIRKWIPTGYGRSGGATKINGENIQQPGYRRSLEGQDCY